MSTPDSTAAKPSLLTPFTYALFRAIWIASVVSNVGTWMQNVAGVWLVTTLTTSALLVALMQTATSLAGLFAEHAGRGYWRPYRPAQAVASHPGVYGGGGV